MQGFLIALAILLVIFAVVVVHESGHFVVGKLSGIRVDEFSVGFGPKLLSRRRGETMYSIRALPLGGFVRMAGMLGLAGEADAGERNFYRASIPKRFATIAAGIVFNFVFAIVCFTIVNAAQPGNPWSVVSGGPAASAGVPSGAAIVSVDGRQIRDDSMDSVTADLHAATSASQGRAMQVVYRTASGDMHTAVVHPELVVLNPVQGSAPVGELVITAINGAPVGTGDPAALLNAAGARISGYITTSSSAKQSFTDVTISNVTDGISNVTTQPGASWLMGVVAGFPGESLPVAFVNGARAIPDFVQQTATGIYQLITVPSLGGVNGPNGLSGPVGIAQATATATQNGFLSAHGLLWWIGFISMNLGLINVLPIPFLDGGKLLFLLIEAIRRKRLEPRHEAIISAVGLALVMLLLIYVTIGDVSRLAKPQ
ncbi:MAG: site-2 protease family protein [Candidatus Dormibacteraeota bacterium]|nr:site-2 protease family protein [Candidatus Dormibacteraeota bacterium]MBV9524779.1 site-2 protease family protein [Candidatus Dormibacteraeota bacterium]